MYRPHVQFWSMLILALMAPALSQQLVSTGQTHQIITALRGCILYLFATYRKSQQVKQPLNTNRIKYNFICVCFDFVQVWKKNHYLQYLPSRLCKSNLLVQYKRFLFHSGWLHPCSLLLNVSCTTLAIKTTCVKTNFFLWKVKMREGKPNSCAHVESSVCSAAGSELGNSHLLKCFHLECGNEATCLCF